MRRILVLLLVLALETIGKAEFPTPYNTEKDLTGPMPAAEAARTMELPPGFHCEVFAAEPDVQQPIAMAWDARGRLWVAECYTYAELPRRWDTNMRDRILIFEDSDNDGHFDKRTVFYDQATYLTSIEIGYDGVYLLAEGGLSFIADKNHDDKPDGPPEVLLDGFNVKTIGHNIVNGLRWGPDGWLYGRHGITDTSAIGAPGTPPDKRTKMNCGLWRFHPTRHTFEVVLNGGTNSWGHDWDANGELFWINTVIGHIFHGIPGSYTDRMFGTHLNPHVYETLPMIADHWHFDHDNEKWADAKKGVSNKTSELGGGHAHVGCVIYNGGTWPDEYKGKLFTGNLHGNRINMEILDRQGCGFVAKHGKDFMKAKDKWFRAIDLSTGPDGNVFVLDWSDGGECHDSDGIHRTSGRIYKIVYGEPKKLEPFDLAKIKGDSRHQAVVQRGQDNNNWWHRMTKEVEGSEGFFPIERLKPKVSDGPVEDGLDRLHLASWMQRLPLEERWPIATSLASRVEDANDRDQPLMIWYGIEPAVAAAPMKGVELIKTAKLPTVRRLIARRITEDFEKNSAAVDALVALASRTGVPPVTGTAGVSPADDPRTDILTGIAAALKGVSQAPKPKGWDELLAAAGKMPAAPESGKMPDLLRDLSLVFGSGRAIDELIAIIKDADADANARRSAMDSLLRNPKPDLFNTVKGLINDKVLGTAARTGLAKFGDQDIPKIVLAGWPDRSLEWRAANVNTLISRAAWTKPLLDAIEQGKLKRDEITPFQARQVRSLNDAKLNEQLTKVWGESRETPEAKLQEIAKWKQSLTPDALAKADAMKGRLVFAGVCAACHKLYGEGAAIAPELTGSDRHNLDYLLNNIVDPNAVVPADYRVSVIKLRDGRVLTGVLPEQNDRAITVQTPTERLTIERTQIVSQEQLPQSLMPEGLLTALGEENVRHLIAYLMSNGQVALPK
jgi:putative membrane-bound dehydrogenase-like protein